MSEYQKLKQMYKSLSDSARANLDDKSRDYS